MASTTQRTMNDELPQSMRGHGHVTYFLNFGIDPTSHNF